ncbi:hypothetical protein ACVCNR_15080 [Aquamicrobium terrae]
MTSQEEWRQIAYQRHLGETGARTGNIYNETGYQTYLERKRASDSFADAFSSSEANYKASSNYASDGRPLRPNETIIVLAGLAGFLVGFINGQVASGFAAGIVVAAGLKGLQLFSRTRAAALMGTGLAILICIGFISVAVYAAWLAAGVQGALWVIGTILGLAALRMSILRWQAFAVTPSGQLVVDRVRLITRLLVLGSIGCAAIWAWAQGYFS